MLTWDFRERAKFALPVIKTEIKKALHNRLFAGALLVGMAAVALCLVYNLSMYYGALQGVDSGKVSLSEIFTLYNNWIGGEANSLGSAIYFYIFPMLAAMPYGWSWCEEKVSGYYRMTAVKCGRRMYLLAKYTAVFVSGGLSLSLPLMASVFLTALFIPATRPFPIYCEFYGITRSSLMAGLFYSHPAAYVALYICLDFVMGGLIACLAAVSALFVRYRTVSVIFPMLICLGIDYLGRYIYVSDEVMNCRQISPFYYLRGMPVMYDADWRIIMAEAAAFFAVCAVAGVREWRSGMV